MTGLGGSSGNHTRPCLPDDPPKVAIGLLYRTGPAGASATQPDAIGWASKLGYIQRAFQIAGAFMRAQLLVLAVAAPIFLFAQFDPPAMAQAASTGGTVGKQDKSASGGEELAAPKSRSHKSVSLPTEGKAKSSGCGQVAGAYKGFSGIITVIKADSTATLATGQQGTWTCANGQVTIVWNHGYTHHLTPKPGGFSAVNNLGWQFEFARM
jgi:hypothetical protein